MITFLNESVLWWHWVVLGLFLLGGEIVTGTFLMLGLGIAAVLVGLCDWALALSFTAELLLWALLSTAVIVVLKRYGHHRGISSSGQSSYGMDVPGTVTETIAPPFHGRVTFDAPVLGSSNWAAKAEVYIEAGARVGIQQIDGQLMLVAPLEKEQ